MKKFYLLLVTLFLVLSVVFFVKGYDKLSNYSNPSEDEELFADDEDYQNVYVGGDAYNYIINSERATGFFVLGTGFLFGAIGSLVLFEIRSRRESIQISGNQSSVVNVEG